MKGKYHNWIVVIFILDITEPKQCQLFPMIKLRFLLQNIRSAVLDCWNRCSLLAFVAGRSSTTIEIDPRNLVSLHVNGELRLSSISVSGFVFIFQKTRHKFYLNSFIFVSTQIDKKELIYISSLSNIKLEFQLDSSHSLVFR